MNSSNALILLLNYPGPPRETAGASACAALDVLLRSVGSSLDFRPGLVISGFLLDYIAAECPSLLSALAELHLGGRVELFDTLYYEPSSAVLSSWSAAEQLHESKAFWVKHGLTADRSLWLSCPEVTGLIEKELEHTSCFAPREALTSSGEDSRLTVVHRLGSSADIAASGASRVWSEELLPSRIVSADIAHEVEAILCPHLHRRNWLLPRNIECPKESSPAAEYTADFSPTTSRLTYRVIALEPRLSSVPDYISRHPHQGKNLTSYHTARKHYLQSQCYLYHQLKESSASRVHALMREGFQHLLSTEVEIDAIKHSDVDPSNGWLHLKERPAPCGSPESSIDNPFIRIYFDAAQGGAIAEFDYKPRKLNLVPSGGACSACFCTVRGDEIIFPDTAAAHAQLQMPPNSGPKVLRRNPDLAALRFTESLSGGPPQIEYTISKDFYVRAGLGAYQANSTTGFNIEYWISGPTEPPADLHVAFFFSFIFPSGDLRVMSGRPLLCAGGETEWVFPLEKENLLHSTDVPGGLYGLRLIDGIDSFIIDLRSAKPFSFIKYQPRPVDGYSVFEGAAGGIGLTFISSARTLWQDETSNTIFLSIY